LIGAVCLATAGCTSAGATRRGIVTFNNVFSDARNEILLLNILRARDGEPLQFSTVSNVNGNMRAQIGLAGGLDNLLLGAAETFNPSGTVTLRNPTVTIAPLETKEFREGMIKPIDTSVVDQLLQAGWPRDVVLNLVIGGIQCDPKSPPDTDIVRVGNIARRVEWRAVSLKTEKPVVRNVRMSPAEAAKALREGAGEGIKLSIDKDSPPTADSVTVQFKTPEKETKFILVGKQNICSSLALETDHIVFRSPLGMVRYLGSLSRINDPYFRVFRVVRGVPGPALVSTMFKQTRFYVPNGELSGQTLAVLAEIIGFQTTNATLNASKPTVTVPADGS
jgi:hypothetical protein